jgi:hypothetical protein
MDAVHDVQQFKVARIENGTKLLTSLADGGRNDGLAVFEVTCGKMKEAIPEAGVLAPPRWLAGASEARTLVSESRQPAALFNRADG